MAVQVLGATAANINGVDISTAALVAATQTSLQFVNGGNVALIVSNGSGSALTVTPVIAANIEGVVPSLAARSVPAGKTWLIGSFSPAHYNGGNDGVNQAPAGSMIIKLGSITSVAVALISVPTTSP